MKKISKLFCLRNIGKIKKFSSQGFFLRQLEYCLNTQSERIFLEIKNLSAVASALSDTSEFLIDVKCRCYFGT